MSREDGRSHKPEIDELKDAFHSFAEPVKANGKVAEILDASALPTERKRVKDTLTMYVGVLAGIKGKNRAVDQSMVQLGKADTEVLRSRKELAAAQTFGEYGIVAIHQVGTMIHFGKRLEDVQRTINKNPIDLQDASYLKEFLELLSFDRAGVMDMKIGSITLRDFINQDKKHKLPIASVLTYFMEGRSIFKEPNPSEQLQQSDSKYIKEYPSYGLSHLSGAMDAQAVMINFAYKEDFQKFQAVQRRYPHAASHVKDMMKKVRRFHDDFIETVLDPDAEEFDDVQQVVQKYLKMAPWYRHNLVNVMSMGMLEGVQLLYRRADKVKEEEKSKPHREFYGDFMQVLREYADGKSLRTGIYNSDDLEEIFTPEEVIEVKPALTVDDLRKKVAEVIPFAPKQQYELNTDTIQWGEVTPPQGVEIEFAPGKPMEFWVKLFYESGAEEQDILWYVNAKKGEFDWNFIEDVNDAKMVGFKNASIRVIANMLEQVKEKASEEKKLRQEEKEGKETAEPVVLFAPQPGQKTPHVREEEAVSKKRKRKREEKQEHATVGASKPESEDESVSNMIVLPEEETLDAFMKQLSHDEIGKVKKGIESFNERGVGQLKLLHTDRNSPRQYSLRVNTGQKGVRVLLQEIEPDGNQRNFEIIDIKRRKDIYRKHGL